MFSEKERRILRSSLQRWYEENRRQLPWRGDTVDGITPPSVSPYGVMVSEIMLQQTRVETVISYWRRWMNAFPNLEALAQASQEEINALWAGLGYYRRAKALLDCAKVLVEKHGGEVPNDHQILLSLPGIGPYTAGAISSIAFNVPQSAVDGNVIRVFSRLRALDEEGPQLEKLCRVIALEVVDPDTPSTFNQALMELGATICKPTNPSCQTCPVKDLCVANRLVTAATASTTASDDIEALVSTSLPKSVTEYPKKVPKKAPIDLKFITVALHRASQPSSYLFSRRPPTGLLQNQWEFPCIRIPMDQEPQPEDWDMAIKTVTSSLKLLDPAAVAEEREKFEIQTLHTHDMPILHIFSHQRHHMYLLEAVCVFAPETEAAETQREESSELKERKEEEDSLRWMNQEELSLRGITTGVKKIFTQLNKDSQKKAKQKQKKTPAKSVPVKKAPVESEESKKQTDGRTGTKKRRMRGTQEAVVNEEARKGEGPKRTKS
jgi:A/G-specific adenine glycosylase